MIRGLVPKERLLEWSIEDGWEPLCEFLGKPIPKEPFPHTNTAAGWAGQESRIAKKYIIGAVKNLVVISAVSVGIGAAAYKLHLNWASVAASLPQWRISGMS